MKSESLWIGILVWGLAASALGYPQSHGPFADREAPTKVPLRKCVALKQKAEPGQGADQSVIRLYAETQEGSSVTVRLRRMDEQAVAKPWEITVIDKNGAPLSEPATNDMSSYRFDVFTADLNRDGMPDFVVNINSSGSGLAGAGSTTTFLLSEKGRYKSANFYSFCFGPEDIVRFKPGGPCYFIQSDLVRSGEEKNKDDRYRNFWVYRLHRFSGGQAVEANGDDARFPKWVWYTFKDNHAETDQLTAEQKKRLMGKK